MASSFKTPALGFSGRTEKTGKRAEPTVPRASLSAFGFQSPVLSAVLLPESFKAGAFFLFGGPLSQERSLADDQPDCMELCFLIDSSIRLTIHFVN